ncbi:hypothetical protein K502DRAFT_69713 [Neoconidiobolus thromboides FSU 785]|nr:hypothetical protein K502DRAFT_69713 [Neoconidiobolus thromboides FSU 785]
MDFKGLEEKFKCLNNSKNSIQKIVSHESFVYIANGNKIGCYLIAQKSKATEYQELFSKEIEFDIIDLSINNNGTYLALYGSNEQGLNKLCVIPLFELNIILSSNIQINPLLVRVLEIDSNNMKDSKIMKVAWHPLSKESTALLVLSSNNFLR